MIRQKAVSKKGANALGRLAAKAEHKGTFDIFNTIDIPTHLGPSYNGGEREVLGQAVLGQEVSDRDPWIVEFVVWVICMLGLYALNCLVLYKLVKHDE